MPLFEDFSDEPQMDERVDYGALQHALDPLPAW
jgi:hypothetical protein